MDCSGCCYPPGLAVVQYPETTSSTISVVQTATCLKVRAVFAKLGMPLGHAMAVSQLDKFALRFPRFQEIASWKSMLGISGSGFRLGQ